MNTPQKLSLLLAAAGLFSATRVSAQNTYTWNLGTGGDFNTAANWNPQAVPGATDTAIIDDTVGGNHSQTVTYDVTTGALLAPINLGTLSLLNGAGAGFTDLLQLTSTTTNPASTTVTNSQGYFVITNAITLGAAAGTVELRLSPTATTAAGQLTLQTAGVTVNTGGILTLDSNYTTTTNATVRADTTISGGTLNILGSSSVSGIGSAPTQRNSLTMSSGNITFGNTNGRLDVFGNFTATGGTITASTTNTIELYGATNSISGVTYVNPTTLTYSMRNTAASTLTSSVDLPNILVRNGQVNTVTVTSPGQNVGQISINTLTASTLKLGSNLNTTFLPSLSLAGVVLDLNGFTLATTATTAFTPTAGASITSSQGTGTFSVASFNFGNSATTNVGANVTILETTSPAANLTSTAGAATFSPTSTLAFTGNSGSGTTRLILAGMAPSSTIGNLVVGNGTSTTFLQLGTAPFNIQGNATVFAGSTLDVNSRTQTLAGKLQGNGSIVNNAQGASGMLTFSSTGGLSPGLNAATNTGSGSVGTLTLGTTVPLTLIGTSVSIFDLASNTSFDSLAASTGALTINGVLNVSLLGGYAPTVGTTWNIFTNLSATSTGTFSNTIMDAQGDTYSFAINGTNGVLTLVTMAAVPEPSTWIMMGFGLLFLAALRRRAFRRVCQH